MGGSSATHGVIEVVAAGNSLTKPLREPVRISLLCQSNSYASWLDNPKLAVDRTFCGKRKKFAESVCKSLKRGCSAKF